IIVNEKAEPKQPSGTQPLVMRQDDAERADDVRRIRPEDPPLQQRLAHQPELEILKIAKAAVDQLGRARRRTARQIAHFTECDRVAAPRRVPRDAAAVDAAANDIKIEL